MRATSLIWNNYWLSLVLPCIPVAVYMPARILGFDDSNASALVLFTAVARPPAPAAPRIDPAMDIQPRLTFFPTIMHPSARTQNHLQSHHTTPRGIRTYHRGCRCPCGLATRDYRLDLTSGKAIIDLENTRVGSLQCKVPAYRSSHSARILAGPRDTDCNICAMSFLLRNSGASSPVTAAYGPARATVDRIFLSCSHSAVHCRPWFIRDCGLS